MSHYFHTPEDFQPDRAGSPEGTEHPNRAGSSEGAEHADRTGSPEHAGPPDRSAKRRTVRARIWDVDYEFTTAPGVFSGDGLDLGTAVLLRECWPPEEPTRLLDLGCGWGAIAVALAAECPDAIVDAVDTNELALALTAANARQLGVGDRVRTLLPSQADPDARYDEIWSNPPIRIGKQALHELLLTWLPRLAPGGTARLVVGRNLGADSLQRWLIEQGYACARVGSAKGFRVFAVTPES